MLEKEDNADQKTIDNQGAGTKDQPEQLLHTEEPLMLREENSLTKTDNKIPAMILPSSVFSKTKQVNRRSR